MQGGFMANATMSLIAENTKDFSLRDLVAPLFRRKRVLIASFFCALALFLFAGLVLMPPPYRAHMDMLVKGERFDPVVTAEPTTQLPINSSEVTLEEINSEVALLTSNDVLEKVVYAAGLNHQRSLFDSIGLKQPEDMRVEKAVRRLARGIKAENQPNTNLIEVTYSSSSPEQTYNVLHYLGDYYLDKHAEVSRRPGSYEFFATETQKYHDALESAEANLKEFSLKAGLAAPEEEQSSLAEQVAQAIGQYHIAQEAIAADQMRIISDQEHMDALPQRSPTTRTTAAADKLLDDLHTQLLAEQAKRAQLAVKYDPQYPLMREADQEIAATNAAIAAAESTHYVTETTDRDPTHELLREDQAKTEADLATQRASASAGKKAIQSMQEQMVDLDQDAVAQQDLEREVKADEDNYLLYLSKREQERTSSALDKSKIGNVALAIPPEVPALPVYSDKAVVLVSTLAALLLALLMTYGADYYDNSFQTPAQVIDSLGIPVVISMAKKTA
jgi:uncharacterized protein involved in exopolysaccharide biosynthesis